MTELEMIAASVAKAMGLINVEPQGFYVLNNEGKPNDLLRQDGANLFADNWQVRCRDWLHAQGYAIQTTMRGGGAWMNSKPGTITIFCPAAEFCARAIHQLMQQETK